MSERVTLLRSVSCLLALSLLGAACVAQMSASPQQKNHIPHQVRYVLTVLPYHKKIVGDRVTSFLLPSKNDGIYGGPFDLRSGLFRVASDVYLGRNNAVDELTGEESIHEDRLAVIVAEFDSRGQLIPTRRYMSDGIGITNADGSFSVTTTRDKRKNVHLLGHWLTDFVSGTSQITPTLCSEDELPTLKNKQDSAYRYSPRVNHEQYSRGTFGCREWGFQLHDVNRPYIDVTSYLRTPRIYSFIGWAGLETRKPIIGLERNQWICLFDCPNGEAPGTISDIDNWAKKNGWEPPQRPARVPIFPDVTR